MLKQIVGVRFFRKNRKLVLCYTSCLIFVIIAEEYLHSSAVNVHLSAKHGSTISHQSRKRFHKSPKTKSCPPEASYGVQLPTNALLTFGEIFDEIINNDSISFDTIPQHDLSEAVKYIRDGIHNMKIIKKADQTWDLTYLMSLRFLPHVHSPCWLEPQAHTNIFYNASMEYEEAMDPIRSPQNQQNWTLPLRLRCLPSFFLAGFPKCATTDLYHKLSMHPEIIGSTLKEPHWWTRRYNGYFDNKPVLMSNKYVSLFDNSAKTIFRCCLAMTRQYRKQCPGITFDASASTVWSFRPIFSKKYQNIHPKHLSIEPIDMAVYNISKVLPEAKAVLLVRDPVSRAYSDFLYINKIGKIRPDTILRLQQEIHHQISSFRWCMSETDNNIRNCAYWLQGQRATSMVRLYVGMYHVYLEEWLRYFPKDSVCVIRTEDYSQSPVDTINKVTQFLGTDTLPPDVARSIRLNPTRHNQMSHNTTNIPDVIARELYTFYRPFNERLAEILRDERFLWKTKP